MWRLFRRAWLYLRFGGREAFIRRYCKRSKVSWFYLRNYRKAVRCDCGDPTCEGWVMVPVDDWITKRQHIWPTAISKERK